MKLGKPRKHGRPTINNRMCSNPLTYHTAKLATYETYIANLILDRAGIRRVLIDRLCLQLDNIDILLNTLIQLPCASARSDEQTVRFNDLTDQLAEAWRPIMPLNEIELMPRGCDDDSFFELLSANINKNVLCLQGKILCAEQKLRKSLSAELAELKGDFTGNYADICRLEKILNDSYEAEIADKVQNYMKYDIVNNEKMTPRFLRMAKTLSAGNLSSIRDGAGVAFVDAVAREDYIVKFYEDLYKLPPQAPLNSDGAVRDFLGDDIVNHPVVQDALLTVDERDRLDEPLTLAELDRSLAGCNKNSAPGIDGVSNKFICRIWDLVRAPLLRYAHCCFEKGSLTDTFSTACIKLIPKKGDTSQLKNWRPISLLSCYYKLISRIINERLGSVIDKVTGRAQKAYSNTRYIHEVIINVSNSIRHCIDNNVPGMLVSIDQKKAFDSIYHNFCNDAFAFFGFGRNFIHMMNTLSTNRTARIILDNGKFSRIFCLERGRPQGDSPSPRQYNIGEQVLLLKIDLDPMLPSVFNTPLVSLPLPEQLTDKKLGKELFYTCNKTDAFADDTNVVLKQQAAAARRLITVLNMFEQISGLGCNIEKSAIMFIGPVIEEEAVRIREMGFEIVENLKILGFNIKADGTGLSDNFERIIEKITGIAGTWRRFNLSLPGRIAISKTFMISQVNYIGSVCTPTGEQLARMQNLVNEFVLNGIPVAKDRLYTSPHLGRLGLLNIESMIAASHCVWASRIELGGLIDCWRYRMLELDLFSCTKISKYPERSITMPVISDFTVSWLKFYNSFYKINDNYLLAPIYNNPSFIRGRLDQRHVDSGLIDAAVIGRPNLTLNYAAWRSATFSKCVAAGRILEYLDMKNSLGIDFNFLVYLGLRRALQHAIDSRAGARESDGSSFSLSTFILHKKRGAKRYRKVLERDLNKVKGLNISRKFCELLNIPRVSDIIGGKLLGLWNISFLPIEIRVFAFQFFNNAIATGDRLGNRYRDTGQVIDGSCAFCRAGGSMVPARETFIHIFLDCPYIRDKIDDFCTTYLEGSIDLPAIRTKLFTGTDSNGFINLPVLILSILFFFEIWNNKKKCVVPSMPTLIVNIEYNFDAVVACSSFFKNLVLNSNSVWCRHWRQARGLRRRDGRG